MMIAMSFPTTYQLNLYVPNPIHSAQQNTDKIDKLKVMGH